MNAMVEQSVDLLVHDGGGCVDSVTTWNTKERKISLSRECSVLNAQCSLSAQPAQTYKDCALQQSAALRRKKEKITDQT